MMIMRSPILIAAFCCLISCPFGSTGVVPSAKQQWEVMEYLYRYGYLERPSRSERLGRVMSVEDLTNAIKTLQRIRGLPETGKLDDPETVKLMDESRCGVPDFGPGDLARRKRRYKLQGTSWQNKELTYMVLDYPHLTEQLTPEEVDGAVETALEMWARASQLKFTKVDDPKDATIKLSFVRGAHGDDRPSDGPGRELAHAFFPLQGQDIAGDVHFDNDEKYTIKNRSTEAVDLTWIALHELGHSLGLDHSYEWGAVMYPFYLGFVPNLALSEDDILAISLLYGKPEVERVTPTPHTDPTVPSGIPDICKLDKIDTIVTTKDSRTYVFRESYFWEIGDTGAGKAQKIKDVWKGLDDNLDAAFTRQETGETYFFKGTKFWKFRDLALLSGPDEMSKLTPNAGEDLPTDLDAALEWPGNGRTYFFKGNKYWRYNWRFNYVDRGYPRSIADAWLGVPDDVDGAQQWKNGRTYFFKGGDYYALRKRGYPWVDSDYPKKTSVYWMGCSTKGLTGGRISPDSGSSAVLPSVVLLVVSSLLHKLF